MKKELEASTMERRTAAKRLQELAGNQKPAFQAVPVKKKTPVKAVKMQVAGA